MKLKKMLRILPLVLVLGTPVSAAQINWGCEVDSVFLDSMGQPLNAQFAIQLGYFESVLGVPFVPTASNASQWSAQWKIFDQATYYPDNAAGYGFGYFTSSASLLANGKSSSSFADNDLGVDFSNQSAYIWMHNTETPGPTAEWFLGRSATASGNTAAWNFPAKPADDCCDTAVAEWSMSDLDTGDTPVYGKQKAQTGAGVFTNTTNNSTAQTFTFVPEPSSSLLLALGGVVLTFRRRRPEIG